MDFELVSCSRITMRCKDLVRNVKWTTHSCTRLLYRPKLGLNAYYTNNEIKESCSCILYALWSNYQNKLFLKVIAF